MEIERIPRDAASAASPVDSMQPSSLLVVWLGAVAAFELPAPRLGAAPRASTICMAEGKKPNNNRYANREERRKAKLVLGARCERERATHRACG